MIPLGGFFVLVIVVIFVGLAAAIYATVVRARAMRAFAAAHGLTYAGRDWQHGDAGFPLFSKGNRRHWANVLNGTWQQLPVVYADYQYTVQEGRNSQTYRFSVVMVDAGLSTPQVEVAPRGLLGRLIEDVGSGEGLQFESADFNHRFSVHCGEPRFAYALIDARMMEALMQCDPGLHVTFGPSRALVWGKRQPVRLLDRVFEASAALMARIPDMVRREYGGVTPPPAAVG